MSSLIRLRECCAFPPEMYTEIPLDKLSGKLKERLSRRLASPDMRKLAESASPASASSESVRFAESLMGSASTDGEKALLAKVIDRLKEEKAASGHRVWRFPISRFGNRNGNGRIYPKELWENVISRSQDILPNLGLADHPSGDDDPGEIKNAAIVWLAMEIDESTGLVYGIGSFVGPYGHTAEEIVDVGGKVGFSTDGFGEFLADGETVNPDTYVMERPADLVLNPSQSVFGSGSDVNDVTSAGTIEYTKQQPSNKIAESAAESAIIRSRNMKVDAVQPMKESAQPAHEAAKTSLGKAEEKAFRKYVESFISDTDGIKNPSKRLQEMAEILSLFDEGVCPDLKAQLEDKLVKERAELENLVEQSVQLKTELGIDDINEFKEQAKVVATKAVLYKEQTTDYAKLCEGLTLRNKALLKENSQLKFKLSLKEQRLSSLGEKSNAAAVSASSVAEQKDSEIKSLSESVQSLKEQIVQLTRGNRQLERQNGVFDTKLREASKELAALRLDASRKSSDTGDKDRKISELSEQNRVFREMVARLQKKNEQILDEQSKKTIAAKKAEEDELRKYEEAYKPDASRQTSAYLNFKEGGGIPVQDYWNTQYARYGARILPFKEQIAGAKTLHDAQNAFLRNLYKIDENGEVIAGIPVEDGALSESMRNKLIESKGFVIEKDSSIDAAFKREDEARKKFGLK